MEASIGVVLVDKCIRFLYCFVIVDKIWTQLPSTLRKITFLRRSLKKQLKCSAKTDPKDVFPKYLLTFLVIKRLVNVLLTNSDPSSLSIRFGLFWRA